MTPPVLIAGLSLRRFRRFRRHLLTIFVLYHGSYLDKLSLAPLTDYKELSPSMIDGLIQPLCG